MGSFINNINQHQDIRILSVDDTLVTLTRLQNRLKDVKETTKKRVKSVDSLFIALALTDSTTPQHEAIVQMCQAVPRCFPKLKSLEICSEMDGDDVPLHSRFALPVQALTALLHPNKGLKRLRELTLDGLRFDTDEDRMRLLVKAITKHEGLKRCLLYDTSMTTLPSGRSGMEKFVSAAAQKLDKLVLIGCQLAAPEAADGMWAGSCLVKICRSTTLRELKLHNMQEFREEHTVMISEALKTNHSLKKLSLLKHHDITKSLKKKKKHKHGKDCQDPENCPKPETLSSDAGTLALANMLKENSCLEELCLRSFDFNEYASLFLGNALENDNTTLLDLWLMAPAQDGGTSSFPVDDPRIDYQLRLNRAGRNKVQQLIQQQRQQPSSRNALASCSREERRAWIFTLINSKRDIDCSFFLLQNIPSLCDPELLSSNPSMP